MNGPEARGEEGGKREKGRIANLEMCDFSKKRALYLGEEILAFEFPQFGHSLFEVEPRFV